MIMTVLAICCVMPALFMILKVRGEEKKNRVEHLLARSVSRPSIMISFLSMSIVTGFSMLFLSAVGIWSAGLAVMDGPLSFGLVFTAALSYYPAVLAMIGVAALLLGLAPSEGQEDTPIYKALRQYRYEKGREEKVKPYFVYNNAQMEELINRMPRSLDEIKQISGFGDIKCQKYGVEILGIIDKYR